MIQYSSYSFDSRIGSVYHYMGSGTSWSVQRKILARDGVALDYFGRGVATNDNSAFLSSFHDDDKVLDAGLKQNIINTYKIIT